MRSVVLRALARRDVDDAVDHYRREAGEIVAVGFVDALEGTLRSIGRRPSLASPRYAHELDMPGLRSKRLAKYPYLIFFVERVDQVEVWRVLHARRDIPSSLTATDD